MSRLPSVSGAKVARLLESLGYQFVRQRGSHARYSLRTSGETHNITVPMNNPVAKGTLNDILTQVALSTGQSKDDLISKL